jgi:MYXO-CTERM domain-containing protein
VIARPTRWIGALGLAGLAVTVAPTTAGAVDGQRVRTPVVWSKTPCMMVVDRSSDPVLHLPYAVPLEDTRTTADEVADGRTHQFFALCQGHDPTDELPTWIAEADVAAAEALGLIDLGTVTGAAILDLHPQWQTCALRITPDDQRRPITFAAAAQGFDLDTTTLSPGAWWIEGFTHDPPLSLWSPRPGVIKVVDDPAIEQSGPAVAILTEEVVVPNGEAVTIEGCISAMPGTRLDLSWAELGDDTWVAAVEDLPVRGEALSIELSLPVDAGVQAARVRIDATDPMGRTTTAFMRELVILLPPLPGCDDDTCATTGGADTTGGSDDGLTSGSGESATDTAAGEDAAAGTTTPSPSTGAEGDDSSAGGCACGSGHRPSPAAFWLLAFVGLLQRRPRATAGPRS